MAQPTEEELLILNSIIYTDNFANLNVKKNYSVLQWAEEFELSSIDNANKPAEISRDEFANIITTIKNNPSVYGNMIINDVENSQYANESGSQRITNATISYGNDLILVYKGTAGDMEWRDNGEGGYYNVADTKQQQIALEYFDKMIGEYESDKIYVSGHSKGGNKAQYIGVLRGDLIEHVYAFDGQGFNQAFLLKYKNLIEKNGGKITNISNELDFVNILLFPIAGNRKYIRSTTSWGIGDGSSFAVDEKEIQAKLQKMMLEGASGGDLLFMLLKVYGGNMLTHKAGAWHSPYSMFAVGKDGMLSLDEEVGQSELMSEVQGLFAHYAKYMRKEDWRYLCYTLMTIMQTGGIPYGDDYSEMPKGFTDRLMALTKGYLQKKKGVNGQDLFWLLSDMFGLGLGSGLGAALGIGYEMASGDGYTDTTRDFTQATKDQLLALVEEVESEPWWDVTKWDVFYRIDKYLLGGVDFPANSSKLLDYYRKVIDMQGTSASEIHRIFDDVYSTESSFASKIAQRKAGAQELLQLLTEISESFA